MDSQFFEKLTMTGYVGVRRWYSKVVPVVGCTDSNHCAFFSQVDLLNQDILVCIINQGNQHWTVLVRKLYN